MGIRSDVFTSGIAYCGVTSKVLGVLCIRYQLLSLLCSRSTVGAQFYLVGVFTQHAATSLTHLAITLPAVVSFVHLTTSE